MEIPAGLEQEIAVAQARFTSAYDHEIVLMHIAADNQERWLKAQEQTRELRTQHHRLLEERERLRTQPDIELSVG